MSPDAIAARVAAEAREPVTAKPSFDAFVITVTQPYGVARGAAATYSASSISKANLAAQMAACAWRARCY